MYDENDEVVGKEETTRTEDQANKEETNDAAAEVTTEEGAEQQSEEPAKKEEPQSWKDKELQRKQRRIKEQREKLAALERENNDLRTMVERRAAGEEIEPDKAVTIPEELIEKEVEKRFAHRQYESQLAATNENGTKRFGENWERALNNLVNFGDGERAIDPNDMAIIMNTDDPARVLYEIGSDPDEYMRISELPPARRAVEYAKLSLKEDKKPSVSKAPTPVKVVESRNTNDNSLRDEDSDADWFAKRRAQRAARKR